MRPSAAGFVPSPSPQTQTPARRFRGWSRWRLAGLTGLALLALWLCLLAFADPVRGRYIGTRAGGALATIEGPSPVDNEVRCWVRILKREDVIRQGMPRAEVLARLGPPTAVRWPQPDVDQWGWNYWKDPFPVVVFYSADDCVVNIAIPGYY